MKNPSRFYHPNINSNGYICHKTVTKKLGGMTVRDRITAVIELLAVPNPNNPYNKEAARDYKDDFNEYYKKAIKQFRRIKD